MPIDPRIKSYAIHPAVGVARVGNSPSEWFTGPEVPGQHPHDDGGFRDGSGAIKRQAARFRVFGLDENGVAVQEITADDAKITWTVHVANTKGAWYDFDIALDLPEAQGKLPANMQGFGLTPPKPVQNPRRNEGITGEDRRRLAIDPGARTISGSGTNRDGVDPRYAFEGGAFFDIQVYLGDLRTDENGHLLVLGGHGVAGSVLDEMLITRLVTNQFWYEDLSDGPVEATVEVDGTPVPADGAWVVVAPPNYAPGIESIVTMYDIMAQAAADLEGSSACTDEPVSFARHIYPILRRHYDHQWVNAGFARDFGWGADSNFLAPDTLAELSDPGEAALALRMQVFLRFRNPDYKAVTFSALPPYYGDAGDVPPANDPRQWMAILPMQYERMRRWAEGDFVDDRDTLLEPLAELGALDVAGRPQALDRAALDECLGGPFHPGSELTWVMRVTHLYSKPFRLRRRTDPEPDWGEHMTSEIALAPDGPLSCSAPGDLTRWMAVPWQADFAGCLSGYTKAVDPFLPGYWPAKIPNEVMSLECYRQVVDDTLEPGERERAFEWGNRVKWMRPYLFRSNLEKLNSFIRSWSDVGIIVPKDGAPGFPERIWVEVGRQLPELHPGCGKSQLPGATPDDEDEDGVFVGHPRWLR